MNSKKQQLIRAINQELHGLGVALRTPVPTWDLDRLRVEELRVVFRTVIALCIGAGDAASQRRMWRDSDRSARLIGEEEA